MDPTQLEPPPYDENELKETSNQETLVFDENELDDSMDPPSANVPLNYFERLKQAEPDLISDLDFESASFNDNLSPPSLEYYSIENQPEDETEIADDDLDHWDPYDELYPSLLEYYEGEEIDDVYAAAENEKAQPQVDLVDLRPRSLPLIKEQISFSEEPQNENEIETDPSISEEPQDENDIEPNQEDVLSEIDTKVSPTHPKLVPGIFRVPDEEDLELAFKTTEPETTYITLKHDRHITEIQHVNGIRCDGNQDCFVAIIDSRFVLAFMVLLVVVAVISITRASTSIII